MIAAHVRRQLMVTARSQAILWALLFHVCLLVGYAAIWGDGVPVVGAREAASQFASAHLALLTVLIPWVVARGHAVTDRNDLARRAVVAGQGPAPVALGTALGSAAVGATVALLGLPLLVLAQQVSARPVVELVPVALRSSLLAAAAAFVTSVLMTAWGNGLWAWVGGTGLAVVAASSVPGGLRGAALALLVLAGSAGLQWRHASAAYVLLREKVT